MSVSFESVFSNKNFKLAVGLFTLLVALWVVMFAVPTLFVNLFDTGLGNLILIAFIVLAAMYSTSLAIGLAVIFIILYRFSHMSISPFV